MENNVSQEYIEIEEGLKNLDKEIEDISCANINCNNVIDIVNDDIKKIDIKVRKVDLRNIKKSLIRKTKILGKWVVRIIPYVIAFSISFCFDYFLIKDVPFYRQPEERIAIHETVIDSDGARDNIIEYKSRMSMSRSTTEDKAYFTTSWILGVDGNYHREIKEYDLDEYPQDYLESLANKQDKNLVDVLYRYRKSTEEIKSPSELTKEELEEESSVLFICRYTDEEDIIIEAQSVGANIHAGIWFLVMGGVMSLMPFCHRLGGYNERFNKKILSIKNQYKEEDIKELKRLLKEKKLKFELVKRNKVTMTDPITSEKMYIK